MSKEVSDLNNDQVSLSLCTDNLKVHTELTLYTHSVHMSPENTHKPMGFYMEVLY